MDDYWPLFGLRLRLGEVRLRPMREADLPVLAAVLPGDVGHDPRLAMFAAQSYAEYERRLFCQGYWKALGTWDPASWVLHSRRPGRDHVSDVRQSRIAGSLAQTRVRRQRRQPHHRHLGGGGRAA